MKTEDRKYESIKSRLRKLLALADRGYQGEAENAKNAIERICKEYGIRIEELFDIEKKYKYKIEIGRSRDMMNLFIRCLSSICDIKGMTYYKPTRSSIVIELTSMQYAEIISLYNWHKGNYLREMRDFKKNFMSAYVGKHDLFLERERQGNHNFEDLTQEELNNMIKVLKIKEAMSDNIYRKQIGSRNG